MLYYYIILYKEPPKSRCPQKSRCVISLWSGIHIILYYIVYIFILYKEPPKSRCPQKSRRPQKSRCVISPSHPPKSRCVISPSPPWGATTSLHFTNRLQLHTTGGRESSARRQERGTDREVGGKSKRWGKADSCGRNASHRDCHRGREWVLLEKPKRIKGTGSRANGCYPFWVSFSLFRRWTRWERKSPYDRIKIT